jgi:hypothetical protein
MDSILRTARFWSFSPIPSTSSQLRIGANFWGFLANAIVKYTDVHIIALLLLFAPPPKFLTRDRFLFFSMVMQQNKKHLILTQYE